MMYTQRLGRRGVHRNRNRQQLLSCITDKHMNCIDVNIVITNMINNMTAIGNCNIRGDMRNRFCCTGTAFTTISNMTTVSASDTVYHNDKDTSTNYRLSNGTHIPTHVRTRTHFNTGIMNTTRRCLATKKQQRISNSNALTSPSSSKKKSNVPPDQIIKPSHNSHDYNHNKGYDKTLPLTSIPNYGTVKTGLTLDSQNKNPNVNHSLNANVNVKHSITTPMEDVDTTSHLLSNMSHMIPPPNLQSYETDMKLSSSSSLDTIFKEYSATHFKDISLPTSSDISSYTSVFDPAIHLPDLPDFSNPKLNYETGTPLGDQLIKYIGVLGRPITLHDFMDRCLRDQSFGYYTAPPMDHHDHDDDFNHYTSSLPNHSSTHQNTNSDDDWDKPHINDNNLHNAHKEGRGHRLIGTKGDFTTAPEISQIFGECIAIWLLTQYENMNKPTKIQLVEIGPGRGTLICDILRFANSIPGVGEDFIRALTIQSSSPSTINNHTDDTQILFEGVHLVEVSENLRITQRESLEALQKKRQKTQQQQNTSWNYDFNFLPWTTKQEKEKDMEIVIDKLRKNVRSGEMVDKELVAKLLLEHQTNRKTAGNKVTKSNHKDDTAIAVQWHDSFDSVPSPLTSKLPVFIVCQELFDAFPVHVFQKTENGWRERMVDVAMKEYNNNSSNAASSHQSNNIQVQMRDGSIATTYAPLPSQTSQTHRDNETNQSEDISKKKTRFRYVLSPGVTPALRTLLHVHDDDGTSLGNNALDSAPDGSIVEVCPRGMLLVQDIASRINDSDGAAIIIDYGNIGSGDTLRGFKKHEQVDVLSSPGMIDITADVDFLALQNAVNNHHPELSMKAQQNDKKHAYPLAFGPISQGQFLAKMGAAERAIMLIESDETSDEQAEDIYNALERLMSAEEMGERYKVMSIARKKDGIFPPAGF